MAKVCRVEDSRQLFQPVNQAWTGTAEVRQGIDEKHRSRLNGRQLIPLWVFRESG